jgi:prepilin-type N-terminal cleavage/methylation domain-containing protein
MRAGFTLLELSIVLVIIGLIIGGVTMGQELIKQGQVKSAVSDFQKYDAAYRTFQLKYQQIPGDFNKASQYWPLCDAVPANCNGDYNGRVDGTSCSECHRAWQHLNLANIVPGSYLGVMAPDVNLVIGKHVPGAAIEGTGYLYRFINNNYGERGNTIELGGPNSTAMNQDVINALLAKNIDEKLDDGDAIRGRLRSVGGSNICTGVAFSDMTGTGRYLVENANSTCTLHWFMS